jgi:hypothetical protein
VSKISISKIVFILDFNDCVFFQLLIDVKDAAVAVGDPKLQAKMMEASTAIKRDIVFAASLYTTQKESVIV